ncbi:MAG: hypothetical protein NUW23_11900 [Firmicutes bacterium]|nr:hypothetical protein [Bacillota bacterium]
MRGESRANGLSFHGLRQSLQLCSAAVDAHPHHPGLARVRESTEPDEGHSELAVHSRSSRHRIRESRNSVLGNIPEELEGYVKVLPLYPLDGPSPVSEVGYEVFDGPDNPALERNSNESPDCSHTDPSRARNSRFPSGFL